MILRVFRSFRRCYSVHFNLIKPKNMDPQKCYFRYIQEEQKIDIAFLLNIKETVRQFNFSRNPEETLETLFARMSTNVQKVLKKAYKKNYCENSDVMVKLLNPQLSKISEKTTCIDLLSAKEPVQLEIYNNVFQAVFNVPWVVSINLPACILVSFPVYPEYLVIQYADKTLCSFKWYSGLSVNEKGKEIMHQHIQWELVGEGFKFIPSFQDVGKKLRLECIPANAETLGPAVEVISKNTIEAGPGTCPFETRHLFTSSKLNNSSFRCVTYNILADLYCDSDFTRTSLHPYCPPYALHIDYRKLLILKELIGYNADIICLQEVDTKMFKHYLEPLLENESLKGQFYKKGKEVAEGLALFYRSEKFELLDSEKIILSEVIQTMECLREIWNGLKDNKPLVKRILDRSTAASATILKSLTNDNELLIVGNTHLYFHPDADHIRIVQGGIFIYWINSLKKTLSDKFPEKRISVILCGDFNSVPSCGIYQLYTTGQALSTLPDWSSNEEEAVRNVSLRNNLLLGSACGTPTYTNFTAGFADCLDYIYYEKSSLQVEQVVPLPSTEELQANTALPSVVFPSDHIALVADLNFKC